MPATPYPTPQLTAAAHNQRFLSLPARPPCLQLYSGCTKRRKVTRNIVDAASGKAMQVEETLEIPVKPGGRIILC